MNSLEYGLVMSENNEDVWPFGYLLQLFASRVLDGRVQYESHEAAITAYHCTLIAPLPNTFD